MPVHDWTRVDAGIFHDFHHEWISEIKRALNRELHGTEYYALAEQITGDLGPDVLTLQRPVDKLRLAPSGGPGVALADAPPKMRFHASNPGLWYAGKKKAVAIRHVSEHRLVAVLEIVSPGNKASRRAMDAFAGKVYALLRAGIHVSLVDVFPPTRRDPEGIHGFVWGDDDTDSFRFDSAKPLTCASYIGGQGPESFVEPAAVGKPLPTIPLFLTPDEYIKVPLEQTYQAAFDAVPEFWQDQLKPTRPNGRRRKKT